MKLQIVSWQKSEAHPRLKMVESLKELNRICQKPNYRRVGNWMVRYILRDAALPITWFLLHTPITANQVTLVSLVIGLIGVACLQFPSKAIFLVGTLSLQIWYLLDHVDGQIARHRKSASLSGRFFDFVTHHLIHGSLFFTLGIYSFHFTGSFFFILWGFLASLAMMLFNLLHDTKYKTFFEKLETLEAVQIRSAHKENQTKQFGNEKKNLFRIGFSFLHKLCEIHVVMNLLTLIAIGQLIFSVPWDFRMLLFPLYGLIVPCLAIVKTSYLIMRRKIDEEFETIFRPLE